MALPSIEAQRILEIAFKPVVDGRSAHKLAMLAFDDEELANKFVMATMKSKNKMLPPNSY